MIVILRIKKGSTAYEILKIIYCTEEFPRQALNMISGNKFWIKRLVRQLINEKYVSLYKKGKIRSLRLLQKGYDVLNVEKLKNNHGEAKWIYRMHRISEVWAMMYSAGIKINPQEYLNNKDPPTFWTSLEIKYDENISRNINSSRFVGAFTNGNKSYIIYNTYDGLLNWSNIKECETKLFLERYIKIDGCIIFGRKIENALEVLNSDGGKRCPVIKAETSFEHSYFLTLDDNGIDFLKIMAVENWEEKLITEILTEDEIKRKLNSIECDGMSDDNIPIMVACSLDLTRIKRLKSAMDINKINLVELFCFSYQIDILRRFFDNKATIYEVDRKELTLK